MMKSAKDRLAEHRTQSTVDERVNP